MRPWLRRLACCPRRIGGIDLDELFEDFAGELLIGRLSAERQHRDEGGKEAHTVIMPLGRMLIVLGLVLVAAGVVVTLAGPPADSIRAATRRHTDSGQEFEFLLPIDHLPAGMRGSFVW